MPVQPWQLPKALVAPSVVASQADSVMVTSVRVWSTYRR